MNALATIERLVADHGGTFERIPLRPLDFKIEDVLDALQDQAAQLRGYVNTHGATLDACRRCHQFAARAKRLLPAEVGHHFNTLAGLKETWPSNWTDDLGRKRFACLSAHIGHVMRAVSEQLEQGAPTGEG